MAIDKKLVLTVSGLIGFGITVYFAGKNTIKAKKAYDKDQRVKQAEVGVGGKIEPNEDGLDAAYRELEEETSITKNDIILSHLMDFTYHLGNCYLEVYVGKLNKSITVSGEENDLYWSTLDHNFFDASQYAGEGNIGHIMMHVEMFRKELLK